MLQGDEPHIYPKNIDLTYKYLLDKKIMTIVFIH